MRLWHIMTIYWISFSSKKRQFLYTVSAITLQLKMSVIEQQISNFVSYLKNYRPRFNKYLEKNNIKKVRIWIKSYQSYQVKKVIKIIYLSVLSNGRCTRRLTFRWSTVSDSRSKTLRTSGSRTVLRTGFSSRLNLVSMLLDIVASSWDHWLQLLSCWRGKQCTVTLGEQNFYKKLEERKIYIDIIIIYCLIKLCVYNMFQKYFQKFCERKNILFFDKKYIK